MKQQQGNIFQPKMRWAERKTTNVEKEENIR